MTKSFRRLNVQEQVYIDTTVCGDAVLSHADGDAILSHADGDAVLSHAGHLPF